MLPEVLPTVDPELGALVHAELGPHEVAGPHLDHGRPDQPRQNGAGRWRRTSTEPADAEPRQLGRRPGPRRRRGPTRHRAGCAAGAADRPRGAVAVDESMATEPAARVGRRRLRRHPPPPPRRHLPAARHHRPQAGPRRRRERPRRHARFAGSLGTQVVKVFDLVAARTGLRDHEAVTAGYDPVTEPVEPGRPQGLLPGRPADQIRVTGDPTGRLLGAQLVGRNGTEIAKRVDIYAAALFHAMSVDRHLRPRPLLHPAARLPVGRRADRRPGLGPRPRTPASDERHERNRSADGAVRLCPQRRPVQLAAGLAATHADGRVRVLSAAPTRSPGGSGGAGVAAPSWGSIGPTRPRPGSATSCSTKADVVVTLKPGLDLPLPPGAVLQTWTLPEPDRWDIDVIRPLRDHLRQRVDD